MANTEQAKQMAEYRRQLRLNTLQNLKNGGTSQGVQTNVKPPQQQSSDAGFFEVAGETALDFGGNLAKGVAKGVEGIYDTGVALIGAIGGWFSDDFEKRLQDHVAIDVTENAFGWLYEATDDSLVNRMGETGQNIVRGVAQGIGQMLPSIAVTVATGGLGAPTALAKGLGMGAFALGATGGATEEAVKGGAKLGNALLYGTASGALETGIEAVSGFVPWDNMAIGALKGAGKTVAKQGAKTALGKATSMFLSEGVEEVASDIANPALKRITGVDSEATVDISKLPETFVIGGLTGVTMGGASRGITNLKYNKAGGSKFVEMAEELDSIRQNEVKLAEFQENKKNTAEQVEDYAKRVDTDNYQSIQNISETLKSLSADKRGNAFLTAPELHKIFEANGEIKADIQNNFKDVSNMNVSANIRHQTSRLNEVLKGVNERHNTNFELDTDKLNDTERTTLAKVTNAVSRLAKSSKYKAFAGLDVAIIKNAKNENAFIKDGVIYLSREHLSSGEWARHVAHEVTHFTEGSKEYNDLANFLTEDTEAVNRASEAIANQGYGYTAKQVKDALAKVNSGETLTENEQEAYSELVSHIAEEVLGNEESINRLTAKNKSLANRIYERIKSFLKAFTGTNADKQTIQRLHKAEQLFHKALQNTGKAQAEFVEEAQKQAKTLDKNLEVAYSKKGYAQRKPSEVTKQEFNHHYWAIANELLSKDELGVLNSAVTKLNDGEFYEQNSDGFYMIPVGENGVFNKIVFTDGKQNNYSINQIIVIYANDETDLSDIRRIIYDGENNGISTQDSELLQIYTSKTYSYNDFVRKISQDKRGSSGEQDGRRSSRKTQFSLKETVEQDVLKEYGNTYNWKETGYILTDGTQLDLSGKKQGARGGYRTVDHRDIFDIYEDGDTYGTEAMIEFMSKGAIRVMPESPGIDLMVEPNKEQYRKIGDLVERLGRQERSFYVDFSDEDGDVVDSLSYEGMVSWRKVVADIKYYFENGKVPEQSIVSQFRFSRKPFAEQVDDVLNGADTVSTHLQVRETTPQIFLDIGLENKPMLITSTHTKTAVGEQLKKRNIHALSRETLKKLPNLLENPAIVMDSTKEGSIVAFVNAVDEDNNPVLCAIKINGTGNYNNLEVSANVVTSVYGKDANPIGFIEKAVDDDRLLYWDKKMSQLLFETPGLQLPDNLKNISSNVIIRKSKYVVNTFNEDSQEKFSRKAQTSTEPTEFLTEIPQEKKTVRERVVESSKDMWLNFQTQLTNQQAGVEKELKRLGVEEAEAKTHLARASYNAGQIILEEGFTDENSEKIGKSFREIWDPIYKKGDEYRREFYEYLFNYLHIDRLKVDKGILNNVTHEQAIERISQLNAQHPEFKAMAKDVWEYNKNLMRLRIELGLITDEVAEYMNNMYPHYVPAFTEGQENKQGISATTRSNTVKQTIKGAKGSVDNKLPPDVIIARQTMEVMRAGRLNQLLNSLYDGVVQKGDNTNVSVVEIKQRWQPNKTKDAIKEAKKNANEVLEMMDEDYSTYDNQPHQYTFYRGAERITISVSDDIDIGLSAFKPNQEYRNTLINLVTKGNTLFKRLVTSANPFFIGRNAIRDLQEALFYSKDAKRFVIYWAKAYKEIASNGKYWRMYKSLGGMSSGLFDYNTGIERHKGIKGAYKKAIGALEKVSMIVEQAPRLAEFIISMERGASKEQALLDSAEVTTNFSRGGKTAKFLNRTIMPFLNPSIQGWSKLYRTVTGKKTVQEWGMLILKALILGIGVSALNDLLLGDDEEYQSLNIRDKENNYLIKIGDNFLKLPKGRVLSVFGSLWIRAREQAKGNENAWDGYIESMSSAVTPVDSFSRTIFSPITDAKTNTTWYGGQIEGRQFENLAPEDRYDESTSSIAIWLGKTFGVSPKKVHYVIDQYSGILGDLVLPRTTKKAERSIFASQFIIDSTLSTRYQNEFYTALDEAYFAKNKGDVTANYIVRYLNSVSTEVSDMYATKREIERSDKSNKDKQAETKVIQSLINTTNKTALQGVKALETAVKGLNVEQQNKLLQSSNKFLKLDENAQKRAIQKLNDYYYAIAMNKVFGIELEEKYTKYSEFNSPELFVYLTEIGSIEGDKDKQGNAISGSRKSKIIKYLQSKGVTGSKQEIILEILGYSTKN